MQQPVTVRFSVGNVVVKPRSEEENLGAGCVA